jgi:hypothetical protein
MWLFHHRPEYRITRGLYNYNNAWLKGLLVAAGIGLRCTAMRADRLNAILSFFTYSNMPSKATSGITHKPIAPRSWANVCRTTDINKTSLLCPSTIVESNHTSSSGLVVIPTPNPFLKGTIPESVFVDITNVENQTIFFQEFSAVCNKNEHLWGLAEKPRLDGRRLFAEFLLSAVMADKLCTEGLKLPSFEKIFWGFFSLSSDSEILKISITGLPRQYGRLHGGAAELKADMIRNLSPYGHVVDCGLISGISDTFTGRGYAVLEAPDQRSMNSSSSLIPKLQHTIHWQFTQLSIRPSV